MSATTPGLLVRGHSIYWLYAVLATAVIIPGFVTWHYSYTMFMTPVGIGIAVVSLAVLAVVPIKFKADFQSRGPVPFIKWLGTEATFTPFGWLTGLGFGYVAGLCNTLRGEAVATPAISIFSYGLSGVVGLGLLIFGWRLWSRWNARYELAHDGDSPFNTKRAVVFAIVICLTWGIMSLGIAAQVYSGAQANPMSTVYSALLLAICLIAAMIFWNITKPYRQGVHPAMEYGLEGLTIGREVPAKSRRRRDKTSQAVNDPAANQAAGTAVPTDLPQQAPATPQTAPAAQPEPVYAQATPPAPPAHDVHEEPGSAWSTHQGDEEDWDGWFDNGIAATADMPESSDSFQPATAANSAAATTTLVGETVSEPETTQKKRVSFQYVPGPDGLPITKDDGSFSYQERPAPTPGPGQETPLGNDATSAFVHTATVPIVPAATLND